MKWIKAISDDDQAMKLVFDHLRNLGICAAVFGAGFWKVRNADTQTPLQYFDFGIAAMLFLVGIWLYYLNQRHGYLKLLQYGMSRGTAVAIGQAHTLVAVTIIASFIAPRGL